MAQAGKWFDITQYGVELSNTATHTTGIKRAIDAAQSEGGGYVFFPEGKYLFRDSNGLQLDHENITLLGEGRSSIIVIDDPISVPITISSSNITVRDLSFAHDQGNISGSWKPQPYPETILITGVRTRNVHLANLHFENPTFGIKTFQVGDSVTIDRISGQPLQIGIHIEDTRGSVSVDGVEFTPTWNSTSTVLDYQTGNSGLIAMRSVGNTEKTASNVKFKNVLATRCKVGFLFTGNGIPLSSVANQGIYGATNTSCVTGIQVNGPTRRLDVVGYTFVGLNGAASECAIHAYDDFGFLNVSDIRSIICGANAIRIGRSSSSALLGNLWLQDWAQSGKPFPAIESTNGTRVEVYQPYVFSQTKNSTAPLNVPQISATNVHLL